MIEMSADIWEARKPLDWAVITTNSTLRKDGGLVMGRGIALEASQRYPFLQKMVGGLIKYNGLRLEVITPPKLIIFPVKHHYKDKADINLILRSTLQLIEASQNLTGRIFLPRVGCGFGHLDWSEVEPMLRHYLVDDRFVVFHKPKPLKGQK